MQECAAGKFHFEPPFTVAVGTRISSGAPRTEPYVRLSRIRLPPRVCDGKANARPRMEDDRFREPGVHQLRHLCPRDPILLTPAMALPSASWKIDDGCTESLGEGDQLAGIAGFTDIPIAEAKRRAAAKGGRAARTQRPPHG